MNIRTFHGKNLMEVMNRVHQELGATPIILESRSDQKGIMITAVKHPQIPTFPVPGDTSSEDRSDEEWFPRKPRVVRSQRLQSQGSFVPRMRAYEADSQQDANSFSRNDLLDELPVPHLYSKNEGYSPLEHTNTHKQLLSCLQQSLLYHNIDKVLINKVLEYCSYHPNDSIVDVLSDALSQVFTFKPLQLTPAETKQIMLIGIPGVGKSTLAAKLAMLALVKGGNVHLITIDTLKTGATYQLEAYARALRTHCSICATPGELRNTLNDLSPDSHVIIDTPGINPKSQEDIRRLIEFICVSSIQPTLVIGAGEDPSVTRSYTKHFSNLGVSKLIATRCDLVDCLGNILTALYYGPYTLAALSFSPYIATPLQPPRSVVLAKHLLTAAGVFSNEEEGDEALDESAGNLFRQAS